MANKVSTTPQDDIAYLRRLAEETQTRLPSNGPYLFAAGIIFGGTCFICWIAEQCNLLSNGIETAMWGIAVVLLYGVFWRKSSTLTPGSSGLANRVTGSLWTAIGWACLMLFLAGMVLNYRFQSSVIWALMPSAIMVLYGVGWMTTAVVMRKPMINPVSGGAMIAAVVLASVDGLSCFYLIDALCFVLLMLVPGLKLTRHRKFQHG